MSEKTQNAFQKYIIPAILAVALIGVILWAAQQKALAESYKNLAKESYVRAYGELTDDLYDMESTLSKLTAVNSPAQYVLLLDEVWRLSGSAVSHMSYLPVSHVDTAELNQFVVRLGDYAHSLTKKAVRGGVMTEEDTNTILQLRDSCAKLAEEYGDKYARGDVPTEGIDAEGYFADNKPQDSEGISEFPTLIYDGPFSESSEKLEPKGLSGGEVTMEQAKTVANIIAGVTFGEGQETGGKIPAYQFSISNEDGTWVEAAVTKQGGKLLWYMSPCKGNTEGKPDGAEGKRYADTALKKLEELGYRNMTATYAQYYGGAALINCAATQNGVILYNDLIKVWVDRETNEVTGVDARNYLFSHTERELPEASVTMAEAEGYLASSLKVAGRQLALIPITPETERLCYEFKCTSGNDSYIVYIGVETGEEEQIFRIIDSEDGQLVI